MTGPLQEGKSIVLGVAPLVPDSGMVSHFQALDNIFTTALYVSLAKRNFPYLGVGRNLAYVKDLWKHLPGHYFEYSSGDDDLLVNHLARPENCAVVTAPEALMFSKAKSSLREFIQQKKRHFSVAHHYKLKHKIVLTTLAFSHWAFLASLVIFLFTPWWWLALALYFLRLVLIFGKAGSYFRLAGWSRYHLVPLLDFIYLIYYPFTLGIVLFRPRYQWQ